MLAARRKARSETRTATKPEATKRLPWLVLLIVLAIAAVEPLLHVWITQFPPEGSVPTGLHVGDSAIFRHYVDCIVSGFHAPAATWMAENGPNDFRFHAIPYVLLYGLFGLVNEGLGIDPLLYLGLINGFSCALYLLAVWFFLRTALPRQARGAFALFSLGGGLGGIAFVVAWLAGWTDSPAFQQNFERFAFYELIEGQHLSPLMLSTRLYYTFPLASLFTGLAFLHAGLRRSCWGRLGLAAAFIGLAGFINFRLGPLGWGIAMAWVVLVLDATRSSRLRAAVFLTLAVTLGSGASFALMSLPYTFQHNVKLITGMPARAISLLTATVFLWLAAAPALRQGLRALPQPWRMLAAGALGYFVAYLALYLGYMAYYGNWLHGGATAAAIAVSDRALLGAVAGAAASWAPGTAPGSGDRRLAAWLTLWLLGFTAISVSALGDGWLLRFTPQRLMVLIPVPLAALAALALDGMPPRLRRAGYTLIIGLGLVSMGVATMYFQGPLQRRPGTGPYAYLHYEYVTRADAALLEQLPPGMVLAPGWSPIYFGEILSIQPGTQVIGGATGANMSDKPLDSVQPRVTAFFAAGTPEAERRAFVEELQVDYVFCPDTCPVDPAVLTQFTEYAWLRPVASAGEGAVFGVRL